jgi:hypothetical protein
VQFRCRQLPTLVLLRWPCGKTRAPARTRPYRAGFRSDRRWPPASLDRAAAPPRTLCALRRCAPAQPGSSPDLCRCALRRGGPSAPCCTNSALPRRRLPPTKPVRYCRGSSHCAGRAAGRGHTSASPPRGILPPAKRFRDSCAHTLNSAAAPRRAGNVRAQRRRPIARAATGPGSSGLRRRSVPPRPRAGRLQRHYLARRAGGTHSQGCHAAAGKFGLSRTASPRTSRASAALPSSIRETPRLFIAPACLGSISSAARHAWIGCPRSPSCL